MKTAQTPVISNDTHAAAPLKKTSKRSRKSVEPKASTATSDIVAGKLAPITKAEPVIPHNVTVQGLVEFSHEKVADTSMIAQVQMALKDSKEWVFGAVKAAGEKLAQELKDSIPKVDGKPIHTDLQTAYKNNRLSPALRQAYTDKVAADMRLSRFRVLYGAAVHKLPVYQGEGVDATTFDVWFIGKSMSFGHIYNTARECLQHVGINWKGEPEAKAQSVKVAAEAIKRVQSAEKLIGAAMPDDQRAALLDAAAKQVNAEAFAKKIEAMADDAAKEAAGLVKKYDNDIAAAMKYADTLRETIANMLAAKIAEKETEQSAK